MSARVSFTCGHDAPLPITGKTDCKICKAQQKKNWDNRDAAHRTCSDHPRNKGKKGVK